MSNKEPNKDLVAKIDEMISMLKQIKLDYPGEFEYVFQGTVFIDGDLRDLLTVDSYDLLDGKHLVNYRDRMNDLLRFHAEIGRFDMMKWSGTCRVYCVEDALPNTIKSKDINGYQWVKKGEVYVMTGMKADINTRVLSITVQELGTGNPIIPPLPYDGFDSRRFILDDYTKLN